MTTRAESNFLIPNASFLLLAIPLVAFMVGILIWALVDVARRSDAELRELGLPRVAWVLVIVLTGSVGGLVYLVYSRARLRKG